MYPYFIRTHVVLTCSLRLVINMPLSFHGSQRLSEILKQDVESLQTTFADALEAAQAEALTKSVAAAAEERARGVTALEVRAIRGSARY